MLVNCKYLDKCSSAGYKCSSCRNNTGRRDYYEPIPWNPWYPTITWSPWYTDNGNIYLCQTTSVSSDDEDDDYYEE